MQALSCRAKGCIGEFPPQELSNTAWSFANIRFKDFPLLKSLAEAAIQRVPEFEPQHLANTMWAFAAMLFEHTPVLDAIASEALRRLR